MVRDLLTPQTLRTLIERALEIALIVVIVWVAMRLTHSLFRRMRARGGVDAFGASFILEQVLRGSIVGAGLLIDVLAAFGLDRIGQVDLGSRAHRNRDLTSLSMMAFSIAQVVMRRLGQRARAPLDGLMNTTMKLVRLEDGLSLEIREMRERELPPIATIAAYRQRRALIAAARAAAGAHSIRPASGSPISSL